MYILASITYLCSRSDPSVRFVRIKKEMNLENREFRLSASQLRIGRLVSLGYCNRDIAAEVGTSEQAVKSSLHVMFDKLGVWNRVELSNYFARLVTKDVPLPEGLGDVLITDELPTRPPGTVDHSAVKRALCHLSELIPAADAQGLINALTDAAFELCDAGTAGLSVLETQEDGSEIFRWDALTGQLAPAIGGTTPRNWSPCGTTLDFGSPQLFLHPERFFSYFATATPLIVEGLVLPVRLPDGSDYATLWIASHDSKRKFTTAEVDVMTSLCAFTMAAAGILGLRPKMTSPAIPLSA